MLVIKLNRWYIWRMFIRDLKAYVNVLQTFLRLYQNQKMLRKTYIIFMVSISLVTQQSLDFRLIKCFGGRLWYWIHWFHWSTDWILAIYKSSSSEIYLQFTIIMQFGYFTIEDVRISLKLLVRLYDNIGRTKITYLFLWRKCWYFKISSFIFC